MKGGSVAEAAAVAAVAAKVGMAAKVAVKAGMAETGPEQEQEVQRCHSLRMRPLPAPASFRSRTETAARLHRCCCRAASSTFPQSLERGQGKCRQHQGLSHSRA